MYQIGECEKESDRRETAADSGVARERKQRFDIADLYEELLARRAELGYRPVLYVSSERDLECNLIGMFEGGEYAEAEGEAVPDLKSVDELRKRLS